MGRYVGAPLALLLVAISIVVVPFQRGQKDAIKQLEQYHQHACRGSNEGSKFSRCIYLVDTSASESKIVAKGTLVIASKERVAIFNDNGLEFWPLRDSYTIRRKYLPQIEQQSHQSE